MEDPFKPVEEKLADAGVIEKSAAPAGIVGNDSAGSAGPKISRRMAADAVLLAAAGGDSLKMLEALASQSRGSHAKELLAAVAMEAARAAASPPGLEQGQIDISKDERPGIDLGLPLREISEALGKVAVERLFRQGAGYVTVDPLSGTIEPMEPLRFCSWAEGVAFTFKMGKGSVKGEWVERYCRISPQMAGQILACDDFRSQVRELRGVQLVRLPVWRGVGEGRTIELLPIGYDEESRIYTVETLPFDQNLDPNEAVLWLRDEVLGNYPWADQPKDGGVSRDKAIQLAAMLSPFVRLLLPPDARQMLIVYTSNQAGSGKTTLAKMALVPVYGKVPARSVDKNEEELRKVIETCAIERKPFLLLDNLTNLRSSELNSFLTSSDVSVRVLGYSRTEEVSAEAQVFVTGNALDAGSDLARRALICELHLSRDSLDRRFPQLITEEWLKRPNTRQRFLAALWAAVRHWRDSGMPKEAKAYRPSYEAYSELVGSIVSAFQFGAPFAPRALIGDREGEAIKELLREAALEVIEAEGENPDDPLKKTFTAAQLLAMAEQHQLIDVILHRSYTGDNGDRRALGKKLSMWKGRELTVKVPGCDEEWRFEFGSRDGRQGTLYEVYVYRPSAPPVP